MGSRGSGGVFNALVKYDVFNTFKSQQIQFVNICDTSNLLNNLADPHNLGLMIQRQLDCVVEVTNTDS